MNEEIERLIERDETLSRITHYSLFRGETAQFDIRIYEILTGCRKGSFIAMPYRFVHGASQYWGDGNTEEHALYDCLAKIKGIATETIFASSQSTGDA